MLFKAIVSENEHNETFPFNLELQNVGDSKNRQIKYLPVSGRYFFYLTGLIYFPGSRSKFKTVKFTC